MKIAPMFSLAATALALFFGWEMAQAPLFASMRALSWSEALERCFLASIGDVGIMLVAALLVAALLRRLDWMRAARAWPAIAFIAIASAMSALVERHALSAGRWTYGENMPIVPVLGVGLAPAIQWIVIPMLWLWVARRV